MPDLELHFEETCIKYNAKFVNTVKKGTSGFNLSEDSMTIKLFKKACDNLGFEYQSCPSGDGSDTNIYNIDGIESINIDIGMSNVYTKEE